MTAQQLPMVITIYGACSIVAAILAYMIASAKHRDASHWATVSFLFPPAMLFTLLLTRASGENRTLKHIEKHMKRMADD